MKARPTEYGRVFRAMSTAEAFAQWLTEASSELDGIFYAQHTLQPSERGVYIAATMPEPFRLEDWEQGRVCSSTGELRWHYAGQVVSLLVLTEQDIPPLRWSELCIWQPTIAVYNVVSTRHILLGTFYQRDDVWFFAEAGVPRTFYYPVDPAAMTRHDYVVMHGKHYQHSGKTILTRFTHCTPEKA